MIRKFHHDDTLNIVRVWELAMKDYYPDIPVETLESCKKDIVYRYLPHVETWIYELDSTSVGFISIYERAIRALFVLPTHQRTGIGTQLIEHVKAIKGPPLTREVLTRSMKTMAFYRNCGFTPTKEGICPELAEPTITYVVK